jgi:hypothetical protein
MELLDFMQFLNCPVFPLFSHFAWIRETSFILQHVHSVQPQLQLDVGFQDERYRHAKSLKWCRSKVCIMCKCDCRIRKIHDRRLSSSLIWSQPLVLYLFLYTSCNLHV